MICIWSADDTATPSSLASLKSRLVYLSGASLSRLSWKRDRLKMICNDFLVVKVNCLSSVFNIMKSILLLRNGKNTTILEKKAF